MDDSDDRRNVFLQAHGIFVWKYKHIHLGIPYSKVVTDGINLNIPVFKLMEDFTIQDEFILNTRNGGYNFNICQDALEGKVKNSVVYYIQQTMFRKYCFVHVLQGACKAAVLDCKSEDDKGTIVVSIATVRTSLATFVT